MQRARVRSDRPADRLRRACGCLVVRGGVHVDTRFGHPVRMAAGRRGDDRRLGEERRALRGVGELAAELSEHQVLRAFPHQVERGRVPEGGGTTDAEHDLVAVGQREQVSEARTDATDQTAHGLLPVRSAKQRRSGRGELSDRFGTDLGRSAAETPVNRTQLPGDDDAVRHERPPAAGEPDRCNARTGG